MFIGLRSAFKHEPQQGDMSLFWSIRSGIDDKQHAPLALKRSAASTQIK
jgi:hypothetical protein